MWGREDAVTVALAQRFAAAVAELDWSKAEDFAAAAFGRGAEARVPDREDDDAA